MNYFYYSIFSYPFNSSNTTSWLTDNLFYLFIIYYYIYNIYMKFDTALNFKNTTNIYLYPLKYSNKINILHTVAIKFIS